MQISLNLPRWLAACFSRAADRSRPASLQMAAAPAAAPFELRRSNPAGLWAAPRLTQIVEVQGARMIYLSGQAAADANYKVSSADFRDQLNAVYDNIETALKSVGAGLDDIVKTTTYILDPGHIKDLRAVRTARYRTIKAPPANTLLVVSRLAEPEFLVEIDVVAAVPLGAA